MAWELLKPVDPIVEETVAPGLWGPSIWSIPPREYWLRLGIAVVLTLYAIFKITHVRRIFLYFSKFFFGGKLMTLFFKIVLEDI
jgi:hypothetical protein